MNLPTAIRRARACGVPLIAVETPDQPACAAIVAQAINSNSPILLWDCVRGLMPLGDDAATMEALAEIATDGMDPSTMIEPVEAIASYTRRAPERTVLIILGADRIIGTPAVGQAIANSRDASKSTRRAIVMLAPPGALSLPADLTHDTYQIADTPPDADAREAIVTALHADAELPAPDERTLRHAVEATRGLSAFAAEQAVALSLTRDGIDTGECWQRWRQAINSTPGLSVDGSGATLDDIGGLDAIKSFARRIIAGKRRPSAIVRVEELEKAMAGAGTSGDTSGTSQGILQALLTWMQEEDASGLIAVGPPGSGKSLCSVAMGSAGDIPTITLDLGALKGSLVGQTEGNIRQALGTIKALAGGHTLWVATCNGVAALPVELRRRFQYGIWFFDLPEPDERRAIWDIWRARYPDVAGALPADEGWTGAEIRTCVQLADTLGISPEEAAHYVVPVSVQAHETIAALRRAAAGRYLSASHPGPYRTPTTTTTTAGNGRKMSLEGHR